jgi:hypothetical protein
MERKVISATENLDLYVVKVKGKIFRCSVCEKQFGSFWATKRHVTAVHSEIGQKPCPFPQCSLKFQSHNQARAHAVQEHGEGDLICPSEDCSWSSIDINW